MAPADTEVMIRFLKSLSFPGNGDKL